MMRALTLISALGLGLLSLMAASPAHAQSCTEYETEIRGREADIADAKMHMEVLKEKIEDARGILYGIEYNRPFYNLPTLRQAYAQIQAHPQFNANSRRGYSLRNHLKLLDAAGDVMVAGDVLGQYGVRTSTQDNALTRYIDQMEVDIYAENQKAIERERDRVSLQRQLDSCRQGQQRSTASSGPAQPYTGPWPPGMTKMCRFTSGPRAGETITFAPTTRFFPTGATCTDGRGSTGIGVLPPRQ